MKKTFILVLNWNRKKLTLKCINSLLKNYPKMHSGIIVIDNGSTDNSVSFFRKNIPQVKVLINKKNLGYGGGNNKGILYALNQGAKNIIILNNDTEIVKGFVEGLLAPFKTDKKIGITGSMILNKTGHTIQSTGYTMNDRYWSVAVNNGLSEKKRISKNERIDFVSGSAICIRSEVIKKIGLFDKSFFMYFEEADYCRRAGDAGFAVRYAPESKVYHEEASTAGPNSPLFTYYNYRNHLLFIEKYGVVNTLLKEVVLSVRLGVKKLLSLNSQGIYILLAVFDYLTRRFGYQKYWK